MEKLNLVTLSNNSLNTNTGSEYDELFLTKIFSLVFITVPCSLFGLLDLVANVINVCVFTSQGLRSSVDISFFAIAVSDLFRAVILQFENFCMNPYADLIDVPAALSEVYYVAVNWPLDLVIRITLHVTVFITAERSFCILFPIQIKTVMTKRVVISIVVTIVVLNSLTLFPVYSTIYLSWKFYPDRNKTLLRLGYLADNDASLRRIYMVHLVYVVIGLSCLIVFTAILISQLTRRSRWRHENAGNTRDQKDVLTTRDRKSLRLVANIAILFVVCFAPKVVITLASFFVPDINFSKRFQDLIVYFFGVSLLSLSVNSFVNIIIYFKLSSSYRQTFRQLVCCTISGLTQPGLNKKLLQRPVSSRQSNT